MTVQFEERSLLPLAVPECVNMCVCPNCYERYPCNGSCPNC